MLREGGSRGDGEAPTHEPITLRRPSEFAHRLLPVHRHAKTARSPGLGSKAFMTFLFRGALLPLVSLWPFAPY